MAYHSFIVPGNIFYGPGSIEALKRVKGERALIVTGPVISSLGIVERVKNLIGGKVEIEVFDKVEADPSYSTIQSIFSLAQDFKPDLFIGLGGGSPMDAGKAAWALYENPDLAEFSVSDVQRELPRRELRKKANYVAVPTTSGTGSEVTRIAVITDHTFMPHLKISWFSWHLVPDTAIIDSELTITMPPELTANTGYDALVHATECYVLTDPSEIADSLAVRAARQILEWMPRAVADGKDRWARDKMHMAALEAGMAFSNGTLWLVHLMAHELSSVLRLPHGLTCAFMLTQCFAFLYPSHGARLVSLATSLGLDERDDKTMVNNLLDSLDNLKFKTGIPLAIKDTGLEESVFRTQTELIIERCVEQLNKQAAAPGLFMLTADEVRGLYMHAWNGTRPELI
ncbi:iron-containing alcohol dehydrogenase [Chloroflexota bacterium]